MVNAGEYTVHGSYGHCLPSFLMATSPEQPTHHISGGHLWCGWIHTPRLALAGKLMLDPLGQMILRFFQITSKSPKKSKVDGSNPVNSPVEVGSSYKNMYRVEKYPRCRISSINSMTSHHVRYIYIYICIYMYIYICIYIYVYIYIWDRGDFRAPWSCCFSNLLG